MASDAHPAEFGWHLRKPRYRPSQPEGIAPGYQQAMDTILDGVDQGPAIRQAITGLCRVQVSTRSAPKVF